MSKAKTHAFFTLGASGLAGYLTSEGLSGEARATVTGGAIFAGLVGGFTPVAMSPWHRSVFHSAAFAAVVGRVTRSPIRRWVRDLLAEAKAVRRDRLMLGREHPDHGRLWFEEFSRYFIAGFLIGAPVGCLSRLARPRP